MKRPTAGKTPSAGSPSNSSDHAQLLAEHTNVIIAEFDLKTSRFVYVTGAIEDQLGYSPEEFLALDGMALVHEDDREATAKSFRDALQGLRHCGVPHRARHRDGSWRWFEDTVREFHNEDGDRRAVVVSHDITQRRTAEEALKHQLYCQTRTAELSHYFLALPADQIAAGIEAKLPIAAELADAESVNLVWLAGSTSGIEEFSTWAVPGSGALPLRSDDQTTSDFRWCVERLVAEEVIHIDDVNALPEEAAAEQADLRRRGVRSSLTIPLRSGEGFAGFFTFERVSRAEPWSDSKIAQLRVLVEIFAAAADRQKRASALRESEERFRAIAEHATELVAEIDHRGVYRYVSPSYRDLLGYEPADLIGRPAKAFVHPEDIDEVEAMFRNAFERQGTACATSRMRHAGGAWRWFEFSGRVFRPATGGLRLVSIGRDVTRRLEMEQAIQRQRDSERRLAELSRHFLQLSTDEIEEAIRAALREVADLGGADRANLVYLPRSPETNVPSYSWPTEEEDETPARTGRWDTMPWFAKRFLRNQPTVVARVEDLPPEAEAERNHCLRRGICSLLSIPIYSGSTPMGCLTLECKREERGWSDQEVTLLRMVGELFTGALRRRRTEDALGESRQQLLHAQKMDAVGRLAGGIAHDFNNLLTIILGFCRPLLGELSDQDPIREDIRAIHEAAERAAALTRQLLTFSRRQDVEAQELWLNDVLRALEPMLERLVGDDVDVGFELEDEIDPVEGDPHHFEQLVLNIAANARDAMPDGGSLVIRTRRQCIAAGETSRSNVARPGAFVSLEIEDSGVGMDEETRQRIFDPFFTTKEASKGTGLGLSLVYGIVEQLGGSISVEAAPNKGTSFRILLPSCKD